MRKLLWNLCSWQLSVETFQKASWYLEGPKCSRCAAVVLPRETGQREGLAWEMLELQVCCGAELCDIFMLMQCVQVCGRCLVAQGISMSMKSSTDPPSSTISKQKKVVQYICCSFHYRATMQAISKPLSPEDKRSDLVIVHMKILHIWTSTK